MDTAVDPGGDCSIENNRLAPSQTTGNDFLGDFQNGIVNGIQWAHHLATEYNRSVEGLAKVYDTVSTYAGYVELGCGALDLASAVGAITIPATVPLSSCVLASGAVSTYTLVAATAAHGLACWGGNQDACTNAVIDGFTIPISEFGGKGIEAALVRIYGKQAVRGLSEAAGNVITDEIRKLITGS